MSGEATLTDSTAIEARRLTLIRFEQAAGAAFGCDDGTAAPSTRPLTTTAVIALAALAVALTAAIAYLT